MSTSSKNSVFENVHNVFLNSLSDKEKIHFSRCSSPEELLKTLENFKILSTQRQKKTLNRCLNVMKKLNDKLRPYFDALNVIASTHDTAAVAYGAFRLVLELASGFPIFFEKLIALLERLADTFPQYSAIVELFGGNPPARIRRHLERVYLDLFRFIQMATRIFTASDGKVKRPLRMIATVIWTPFDAQFSGLINAMDHHRNFIIDELRIHQAQQAKDSERAAGLERERAEKERQMAEKDRQKADDLARQSEDTKSALALELRESTIQRTRDWLAPPQFVEALENGLEQREEGTTEWIFKSQVYQDWFGYKVQIEDGARWNKMPPWVLWVHGNPGCGKTILAASVIEELFESSKLQSHQTCYFFFKYDDPKNCTLDAALRSVLAQILHRNRDVDKILDIFLFARVSISLLSGQNTATSRELHELLRLCVNELGELTLIFDGIDEAHQPDELCPRLKELVTVSPIKVIIFSRPSVNSLHKLVNQEHRIAVDRKATSPDISLFLEHQIWDLVENQMLPDSADIENLAEKLLYGADGMFLWAKLMVRYLNSIALSQQLRLDTINSVHFPEGLNSMYDRIFSLITTADAPHMDLARRILLWINNVADHSFLTCRFLHDAVGDDHEQNVPEDFTSTVISVCGGLVEFNSQHVFQLTHLTVKDYFKARALSHSGLSLPLLLEGSSAAEELTVRCLHYIRRQALTRSHAKNFRFTSQLRGLHYELSFVGYAIKYWPWHLQLSTDPILERGNCIDRKSTINMLEAICGFLRDPFALAFWLEGFYGHSLSAHTRIEEWAKTISSYHSLGMQEIAQRLLEFCNTLTAVDKEWGSKLRRDPSLIWSDVTIFSKIGFLAEIGKVVGTELVTNMEPLAKTDDSGVAVRCLSTISSLTSDGTIMATINIYPSSSFERFWKSIDPNTAYKEAEKYCSGWTAKYEIWSTESKVRIANLNLALPESEIRLLVRQSFRQDPYKQQNALPYSEQDDTSFDTSFPLAIGPDCLTFSILRTIYTIVSGDSSITCISKSCILPLEFLVHFESKWGSCVETFDPDDSALLPPGCWVGWRDWYTYSVSFSGAGDHIAFADYHMPCVTHLAIFEVVREPDFGIRLLRSTVIRSGPPRVREVVFHSKSPFVAFLSENKIWVWDWRKYDAKPSRYDGNHRNDLHDVVFESLEFSACGMFIVARNRGDIKVLPIPTDMLAPKPIAQPAHAESRQSLTNSSLSRPINNSRDLQHTRLGPGNLLAESHIMNIGNESKCSQTLLVTSTNNELKVESVRPGISKHREHLHILSLPSSFSTENTTFSLQIPTPSTDSMRIVFGKRAAESYSLSDGRQVQFPSIVERKLTSIVGIGEAVPSHLHVLEGIPPSKRLKLDIEDSNSSREDAGEQASKY